MFLAGFLRISRDDTHTLEKDVSMVLRGCMHRQVQFDYRPTWGLSRPNCHTLESHATSPFKSLVLQCKSLGTVSQQACCSSCVGYSKLSAVYGRLEAA